jgi:hypothetical protein
MRYFIVKGLILFLELRESGCMLVVIIMNELSIEFTRSLTLPEIAFQDHLDRIRDKLTQAGDY